MITFQCPEGGSLIHAPTLAELNEKRAIHAALWHGPKGGPCKSARQGIAPIYQHAGNLAAMASFRNGRGGY